MALSNILDVVRKGASTANSMVREVSGNVNWTSVGKDLLRQVVPQSLDFTRPFTYQGAELNKISSLPDPHLVIDWDIQMPTLPRSPVAGGNVNTSGFDQFIPTMDTVIATPDGPTLASEYVSGCDFQLPGPVGAQPYHVGSTHHYSPLYQETSPVALTFNEDCWMTVTRYLNHWRTLIRNPDGTYNYPTQYKRPIVLKALDPAKKPVMTATLFNCWPMGGVHFSYGSGSSQNMQPQQQFQCDAVLITFEATSINPLVVGYASNAVQSIIRSVIPGVGISN